MDGILERKPFYNRSVTLLYLKIERMGTMQQTKHSYNLNAQLTIEGKVVHGRKQGRELGFPTANIDTNDESLSNGVYGVYVSLHGKQYRGIMNVGFKPTYGSTLAKTVEVHILDFNHTIYDEFITCQVLFKIREEQKFPSLEFLIQQIKEDTYYANEKFTLLGDYFKTRKRRFLRKEQVS